MIPRLIHQTWSSTSIPDVEMPYVESWRRLQARSPLDAADPFVLTAAIGACTTKEAPLILPAVAFSPVDKNGARVPCGPTGQETLARHHWHGSWWKEHTAAVAPPPTRPRGWCWLTAMRETLKYGPAVTEERVLAGLDRARLRQSAASDKVLVALQIRVLLRSACRIRKFVTRRAKATLCTTLSNFDTKSMTAVGATRRRLS